MAIQLDSDLEFVLRSQTRFERSKELSFIESFIDCPECAGKGSVIDDWPKRANRPGEEQTVTCTECDGCGELPVDLCNSCLRTEDQCQCETEAA